jgi:hypothetical protein
MKTVDKSYTGTCFCGAVSVTATGAPFKMGYCHCESCRSWSASPVNALTLWRNDAVEVVHGAEHLASYAKTDRSHRTFCRLCGGHIMSVHPHGGYIDVYAATIPGLNFVPELHVRYRERVLRIHDGLPKYSDLPTEFGGSGELLPE